MLVYSLREKYYSQLIMMLHILKGKLEISSPTLSCPVDAWSKMYIESEKQECGD